MDQLNLALVQTRLIWENHQANRDHFEVLIRDLHTSDLVILPEMFSTGFTMDPKPVAEQPNGLSFQWMVAMSKHLDAVIVGSVVTEENGQYYNRLYWVQPDDVHYTYDKRHLFRMAGEDGQYVAGKASLVVHYKGWNISPFICYDLRFPVWSRNVHQAYDLGIYVANWPSPRKSAWQALLPARAIENQVFIAGVNRIGMDGNEFEFAGNSAVYGPKGEVLGELKDGEDGIVQTSISLSELNEFRKKFPVHLDGDAFELKG